MSTINCLAIKYATCITLLLFYYYALLFFVIAMPIDKDDVSNSSVLFTVMTMNVWKSGSQVKNGFQKIVKHLFAIDPDILALQEINYKNTLKIRRLLNKRRKTTAWSACRGSNRENYPHILTKFSIVSNHAPTSGSRNTGCQIRIRDFPTLTADVWNIHLRVLKYSPSVPCNYSKNINGDPRRIMRENEFSPKNRYESLRSLLDHRPFALLSSKLIILMGDFNAPSHLDWIETTKSAHCNITFQWPMSLLLERKGFRDSYRDIYPDPASHPGDTWSPVFQKCEALKHGDCRAPQDRIDFIYYKSSFLKPISSRVYHGEKPVRLYPNYRQNDWPSDHSAVITEFSLTED